MKKRILSLLLAIIMVLGVCPVTVLAEGETSGHDLYVTENGEPAEEGVDYEWSGDKLYIKQNGLTVSGVSTAENISVESGVSDLTIDTLSIHTPNDHALIFNGTNASLILKGSNTLDNTGGLISGNAIAFASTGEIKGDGDLTTHGGSGGIYAGKLTVSASGRLEFIGDSFGMFADNGFTFTGSVNKVIARTTGVHAIKRDSGNLTVSERLTVTASLDGNADESAIIGVADCDSANYVKLGEERAKSVLIVNRGHDLSVTENGERAEEGVDYEWVGDSLVIKSNGLTVSGETTKENIQVESGVGDLTIKDLRLNIRDDIAIRFLDSNATLILKGQNSVDNTSEGYSAPAISFQSRGEITGVGTLTVKGVTAGVQAGGILTVSASGRLEVIGASIGMSAYKGFVFTDSVKRVIVRALSTGVYAIKCPASSGGSISVAEGLILTSSADADAEESEITDISDYSGTSVMSQNGDALSVLIVSRSRGLSVTENGEAAEEGVDYEWNDDTLVIKSNGLTVSGVSTGENISVESGVSDLTVKNLSVNLEEGDALSLSGDDVDLILMGKNSLSSSSGAAICFAGDGTISGSGDLTASGSKIGVKAEGKLTVSASGRLELTGDDYGIHSVGAVEFTESVRKVLAYNGNGNDSAIGWDELTAPTLAGGLRVNASDTAYAGEADITDPAIVLVKSFRTAGSNDYARSILIEYHGFDLSVAKNGEAAERGADYDWEYNVLVIKQNGLTVSGSTEFDQIKVAENVSEITIKDLSLTNGGITLYGSSTDLISEGENYISAGEPIFFLGNGTISGTGNLTAVSDGDAVFVNGTLTVSASGNLDITADDCAFYANGITFTDSVTNVIARSRGGEFAAIEYFYSNSFWVADGLTLTASINAYALEQAITFAPDSSGDYLAIGAEKAKSVLIRKHDLSVTRDGEDAEIGEDYIWSGNMLVIKQNGLTVSGETTKEHISVESRVGDLTIDTLSITTSDFYSIMFDGDDVDLILRGQNTLNNPGHSYSPLFFAKNGEIKGSGNLTATGGYSGADADGKLTVSASGRLEFIGDNYGLYANGIEFTDSVTRAIIRATGENGFPVSCRYGSLTVSDGLNISASLDADAEESEITDAADYSADVITVGGECAKSVLIDLRNYDLSVTRDGEEAEKGVDYRWDGNSLVILKDGLTVSGTSNREHIRVYTDVKSLSIEDLSISVPGSAAIIFMGDGAKLTVKGENVLSVSDESHLSSATAGVIFPVSGEIGGSGSLSVVSTEDGLYAAGTLTVSATGTINTFGNTSGIHAGNIVFTDEVTKVIARSATDGASAVRYGEEGTLTLPTGLHLTGSTAADAEETDLTGKVIFLPTGGSCNAYVEAAAHAVLVAPAEHSFTSGIFRDNGDGTHSEQCALCDVYSSPVAHSLVGKDQNTHVCSVCYAVGDHADIGNDGYCDVCGSYYRVDNKSSLHYYLNTEFAATVCFGVDGDGNPVFFRVIGDMGSGVISPTGALTLIAEDSLGSAQFNTYAKRNNRSYAGSALESAIGGSVSLGSVELAAVLPRTLTAQNAGDDCDGISGTTVSGATLWPLTTKNAFAMNASLRKLPSNGQWWLASPGTANSTYIVYVDNLGEVKTGGDSLYLTSRAVRPALYLKESSIVLVSAADGGKAYASVGGSALENILPAMGDGLKLTLLDSSRTFSVTHLDDAGEGRLELFYTGAKTGDNEFISYYITDADGKVISYARIANASSASGSVTFTKPEMNFGETFFVINECDNGTGLTDFASSPTAITLPHTHSFTSGVYRVNDDGTHSVRCTECSEYGNTAAHVWVRTDDAKHSCVECGTSENHVDSDGDAVCDECGKAFDANGENALTENVNTENAATVYFGKLDGEGIPFRVVGDASTGLKSPAAGLLTLFSAKNLSGMAFGEDGNNVYANSNVRAFLDHDVIFSTLEKAAIEPRTLAVDAPGENCDGVAVTEVRNALIWAPTVKNVMAIDPVLRERTFWLASPGSLFVSVAINLETGVFPAGFDPTFGYGVSGALYFDPSSILFLSAAEGGKSTATVGGDAVTAILPEDGNAYKMTLADSSRSLSVSSCEWAGTGKVKLTYSGARTGENEYISYLVLDEDGTMTAYGKIASAEASSGSAVFLRPAMNDGDKFFVFSEQENGDKLTDYASRPIAVTLPCEHVCTTDVYRNNGDGTHSAMCDLCDEYFNPQAHEYTYFDSSMHVCDKCGDYSNHSETNPADGCDRCHAVRFLEWNASSKKLVLVNPGILPEEIGDSDEALTLTDGWYIVRGTVNAAKRITVDGRVRLILADGAVLNAAKGIGVTGSSLLTVYAQSENAETAGRVIVPSFSEYAAAIGGDNSSDGGSVVIHGGSFTLASGMNSASIGGAESRTFGTITIYGGIYHLTTSAGNGAAIGTGSYGDCGDITISGGVFEEVAAAGTGAGIGSGYAGTVGDITISGGDFRNVSGGSGAAGIGGGYQGDVGDITISGGIGRVKGGSGVGIGSGNGSGSHGSVTYPDSIHYPAIEPIAGSDFVYEYIGMSYFAAKSPDCNPGHPAYYFAIGTGNYYSAFPIAEENLIGDANALAFWLGSTGAGYLAPENATADSDNDGLCDNCGGAIYYRHDAAQNKMVIACSPVTPTEITSATLSLDDTGANEGWYIAKGTVTVSERLIVTGNVNLILAKSSKLTVTNGIGLNGANSSITISAQTADGKTGELIVNMSSVTDYPNAAIGGGTVNGKAVRGGDITINGGIITADGGSYSTGIGAGRNSSVGRITINGGTVKANTKKKRSFAAGIGATEGGSCGDITINGGSVTATGGQCGAGIGAGWNAGCGNITINGGIITANGGSQAAGIGGTNYGHCGNITINGGTVNAYAKNDTNPWGGAGIGSGNAGVTGTGRLFDCRQETAGCEAITINGGTVTANGAYHSAGIGTGSVSKCGPITITGGTVTAKGGDRAPGIGAAYKSLVGKQKEVDGGYDRTYQDITITGGNVKSTGGEEAPGIGAGYMAEVGSIIITGGNIEAITNDQNAAAIGSGPGGEGMYDTICKAVTVTGGTIIARTPYSNYIGRGNPYACTTPVYLTIDESLSVETDSDNHVQYVGFDIVEAVEPNCGVPGHRRAILNPNDGKYYTDFSFAASARIGDASALAAWMAEGGAGYLAPTGEHADENGDDICDVCEANLCKHGGSYTIEYMTVDDTCTAAKKCGKCGELFDAETVPLYPSDNVVMVVDVRGDCHGPSDGHFRVTFSNPEYGTYETPDVIEDLGYVGYHVDENRDGFCDLCEEYDGEHISLTDVGSLIWDETYSFLFEVVDAENKKLRLISDTVIPTFFDTDGFPLRYYNGKGELRFENTETSIPTHYVGDLVIPSTVSYAGNTYTVTEIGGNGNDDESVVKMPFLAKTGLTSVTLPDTLENIGRAEFLGCTGLTSVEIPANVTEIGSDAFLDCTSLTSVTFLSEDVTVPHREAFVFLPPFGDCDALERVIVPAGKGDAYREAWEYLADLIVEADDVFLFDAKNLALESDLGFRFKGYAREELPESSYMEFSIGDIRTERIPLSEATVDEKGRYVFTCHLNVLEAGEPINAVFHTGETEDRTVSTNSAISVSEYLNTVDSLHRNKKTLTEEDIVTLEMVWSTAFYLHSTQIALDETHDNYTVGTSETDTYVLVDMIDAGMDELFGPLTELMISFETSLPAYKAVRTTKTGYTDVTKTSRSLVLDDKTAIVIYLTPASGHVPTVSVTDSEENPVAFTSTKQKDGRYRVVIGEIAATDLDKTFTVTVDGDGIVFTNLSALSYVYSVKNSESPTEAQTDGVTALGIYALTANAYQAFFAAKAE